MVDYRINGLAWHFFDKVSVSDVAFASVSDGYMPDVIIPFTTQTIIMVNEETGAGKVVEYSFTGFESAVHGELDPQLPTRGIVFDNIKQNKIWFRVKSGSAGPLAISVHAWANGAGG